MKENGDAKVGKQQERERERILFLYNILSMHVSMLISRRVCPHTDLSKVFLQDFRSKTIKFICEFCKN